MNTVIINTLLLPVLSAIAPSITAPQEDILAPNLPSSDSWYSEGRGFYFPKMSNGLGLAGLYHVAEQDVELVWTDSEAGLRAKQHIAFPFYPTATYFDSTTDTLYASGKYPRGAWTIVSVHVPPALTGIATGQSIGGLPAESVATLVPQPEGRRREIFYSDSTHFEDITWISLTQASSPEQPTLIFQATESGSLWSITKGDTLPTLLMGGQVSVEAPSGTVQITPHLSEGSMIGVDYTGIEIYRHHNDLGDVYIYRTYESDAVDTILYDSDYDGLVDGVLLLNSYDRYDSGLFDADQFTPPDDE